MQSRGFIEAENTLNQFKIAAFNNHEITETHCRSMTKWIKLARSALNTISNQPNLQLFLCEKCLASLSNHQQTTDVTTCVISKDLEQLAANARREERRFKQFQTAIQHFSEEGCTD
jgi:hypothetical protein